MAALAAGNGAEHVSELKSLRLEFKGAAGVFEFLGPKVPEATAANPTRMRVQRTAPAPFAVVVELPAEYPSDAPPVFRIEAAASPAGGDGGGGAAAAAAAAAGGLEDAQVDAIEAFLAEQAGYMRGMACISATLRSLDDLDLADLDLGSPGRFRSIFTLDLVNNSPHFKKALEGAAAGNPCAFFYRTIACQNNAKFSFAVDPLRSVFVVCDAPDKAAAVSFMKTMRTDGAMDYDMLGKISKVQLSVVEEFELAPFAPLCVEEGAGCFAGAEYRTDEDREALMGPLMASTAGVKKR